MKILRIALAAGIGIAILLVFAFLQNPADTPELNGGSISNDQNSGSTEKVLIGNPTDVGTNTGIGVLTLETAEQIIAFRFTAKYGGEVQEVVFNALPGFRSDVIAGLQGDVDGKPSGQWLGKPGMGRTADVDPNGFIKVDLDAPAHTSQGEVYHLVIQSAGLESGNNTSGAIQVKAYNLNSEVQPLNDENLDVTWPDSNLNTLYYDGVSWEERRGWPIFVVRYADGSAEGQPYSLSAQWVVYGTRYVGQEFIPSSDYLIEEIGFYISKRGNPSDSLYYEVRNSESKVISRGTFAEAINLNTSRQFVTTELDEPVLLRKDQVYRIALLSPGTSLENPFWLIGQEYTYDPNISYGAVRHVLAVSYDSGSSWSRWQDADAIFTLSGREQ